MLSTLSVAQIQILCHGAALGFFLVLGQVISRNQQPLIRRDLLVNIGTGLGTEVRLGNCLKLYVWLAMLQEQVLPMWPIARRHIGGRRNGVRDLAFNQQ